MSKYHARPTIVDGIRFDSQAEARRYGELKLLEQAGKIAWLEVHPRFELLSSTVTMQGQRLPAVHYEADFSYYERGGRVIEDVKGVQTPVFRLKRRLFLGRYQGVELRIVQA